MASRLRVRRRHTPGRSLRPKDPPSQVQKDLFLRTYAETLSAYDARRASSITRKQFLELMDKDAEFAAAFKEILDELPERAEEVLARLAIQLEDRDLLRFYLTAFKGDRYATKTRVDVSVRDLSKLSDEELEDLIAKHSKGR